MNATELTIEPTILALRAALAEPDNPTGAARALARFGRRFPPAYEGGRAAMRLAATDALKAHGVTDAKALAWAVLDSAWTGIMVPVKGNPRAPAADQSTGLFDPITAAFDALEAGAPSREIVSRFAVHAAHDHRLGELVRVLDPYDQDRGRLALLEYLIQTIDNGFISFPRDGGADDV